MYAIVEIAGQQFKVAERQKIYVHRLAGKEGDAVSFSSVLLLDRDGTISVGAPIVENAVVNARILANVKADKVLVFHKKRRKGYRKLNGHRQQMTQLEIESINVN